MTHEEAFLQAIIESPEDDAPRLVYADWLEERGDPRGEFLRLECRLRSLPEACADLSSRLGVIRLLSPGQRGRARGATFIVRQLHQE
jgi:uncharacterized protein (TIGR02996 family)